jgi:RNA polymerase sigma factor (sigma-70 family)
MRFPTRQLGFSSSQKTIYWYMQDLAHVPDLSLKEEQDLLQQIAADPCSQETNDARKRLIEGNLRLVVRLACRYQPSGLELSDLIQDGNLALVQATQEFDPGRNQHFRLFITRRIGWALSQKARAFLYERHILEPGYEPFHPLRAPILKALAHDAIDEQALAFEFPEERFVSLDVLLKEVDTNALLTDDLSPNRLFSSDEETPDEAYLARERGMDLAYRLQSLTPKERLVLTYRYLLGVSLSLEEVGKVLGISRERVRQLEEQGIQKMRHPRISRTLRHLL